MIRVRKATTHDDGRAYFSQHGSHLLQIEADGIDDDVDGLDADERHDHAADAVDQQVAAQQRARRLTAGSDTPLQRQRDERDDDQRVEDDRRQDGALRRRADA